MLEIIFYIIILIAAVPIGYLLKYLTRDEQEKGKKWFFILLVILVVVLIVNLFFSYELRTVVSLSLGFMIIVVLVNVYLFRK